jgi:hypothetical protein
METFGSSAEFDHSVMKQPSAKKYSCDSSEDFTQALVSLDECAIYNTLTH